MTRLLMSGLITAALWIGGAVYSVGQGDGKTLQKAEIFVQLGHGGNVAAVAFSPDGHIVVSGSMDSTLKLWDPASGRELRTLSGHTGVVYAVAFSPDGRMIISGGDDKTLKLWDAASGRELRTLIGHNDRVVSVAFSPDGRSIVSGSWDKTLKLWDVAGGRELRTMSGHSSAVNAVAFSSDGRTIVSGSGDSLSCSGENDLKLWDVASGRELRTLTGHSCWVNAVAFSPNGHTIVSASGDMTLKLWDAANGRELRTLRGHNGFVRAVNFSPDGRTIVSGGFDETQTDHLLNHRPIQPGSPDNTLKLWDAASGRELRTLSGHTGIVWAVAFSPDGRTIVSGSEALKLWDVASGRELRTLSGESSAVTAVAVSPDGRAIVSGGLDLTINLWDDTNGRRLRTLNGHSEYVKAVAFSPDGRTIVSGSKDKTLKLWDVASGRELRTLSGHTSAVNAVAFSPDGRTIVSSGDRTILGSMDTRSCSGENNLKLWDAASGRELRTFNEHSCWIYAVAFSPDGHTIVSSAVAYAQDGRSIDTNSGILRLWDAVSGREIRSFNANSNGVNAVAFSPDGRTIVSGGGDKTLKLWDAASGRELRTLSGHTSAVWAVAFSPDGRAIVSGSGDKTIKLWDAATGQELHTLIGHKGGVLKVSFSPNGRNVISGSGDGTVRQWDVSTEKEIVQFVGFKDGEWVTITPEGYYNSSENGDKHLNVRVGNGLNDVFGLDQYRESFYRPDFVKLALAGGSPSDYGNIVSAKHPPQVRIVDTPESTSDSETKVTLRLTDMGGGIGDVRLYLNGSAVMRDNARSMQVVAKDDSRSVIRTYSVKLINGKNSIRAIAFNSENSVQSVDALHEISALFRATTKPTLHAVVVGINEFANPRFTLKYAVADAELFAESLAKSAAGLFEKVDIIKLTTRQETTSENIKKELMALRSLNPDDLFVFYVASHGQVDDGEYFLITSNVGLASTEHLKTDALTQTELKELIANIPTTKKVIVLDTCNSGAMGDVLKVALLTRGMSEEAAINIFSRAVGSTILSASTSTQEALEGYKEHGLFTFVLAEGLSGKADKGKSGFIKTIDLVDYVETEVPPIAETIYNHKQFPYMSISGQPFYIGKVVMP